MKEGNFTLSWILLCKGKGLILDGGIGLRGVSLHVSLFKVPSEWQIR